MEWVITCNPNQYNVNDAFKKLTEIEWKQSTNVAVNDIVYIYIGGKVKAISYKCIVEKVNLDEGHIDDSEFIIDDSNYRNYGRYMRLKLVKEIKCDELSYKKLLQNGLKTVQGPSKVTEELSHYINSIIDGAYDVELQSIFFKNNEHYYKTLIAQFENQIQIHQENEANLEKIRRNFVDDYNLKNIMKMTKEDYVVGQKNKKSFCYRIERELKDLGDIRGATSHKFGIYYSDEKSSFVFVKKYGDTVDDALDEIKKQICELIINGNNNDLEKIRACLFGSLFRGKILSVYFPEEFLSIFSEEHIDYFIRRLNIQLPDNCDILDKQQLLIDWKNKREGARKWSNYLFCSFLYSSFGKPFEDQKKANEKQKLQDDNYSKDKYSDIGITYLQWKSVLGDINIFNKDNIELLKRIYFKDNHATAFDDLSIEDGVQLDYYFSEITSLAQRISGKLSLPPLIGDDGARIWWRILFWGKYRDDGLFELKLRPELVKALESTYTELIEINSVKNDCFEDAALIDDLKNASVYVDKEIEYKGIAKERALPKYNNGCKFYHRDRQTAINALAHANYRCEIDKNHFTFYRKKADVKYTEPHHLVPMAFSDDFDVSLDVEENIVSLCSTCHNQIHYGKDGDLLLKQLFEERNTLLKSVGINISFEELLKKYGY